MTDTAAATDAIAEKRTGCRFRITKIAEITGFSVSTIENYIRQGMPVAKKGGPGKPALIDMAQLIHWLIKREREKFEDKEEVPEDGNYKNRKLAAQAKIVELEYAKLRGLLVETDAVTAVVTRMISDTRARLLGIPTKTAPQLTGRKTANEIKAILEDRIYEALNELSRIDPVDFIAPAMHGTMEAPAETDGESVGGPVSETESGKQRGTGAVEHGPGAVST